MRRFCFLVLVLPLMSCGVIDAANGTRASDGLAKRDSAAETFSIAVIPDTQNAMDYKHQKAAGFAIDASEQFIDQMQYIANRAVTNGGDIVFVASVGDVWQHQSIPMDLEHRARGVDSMPNPFFATEIQYTPQTLAFEVPKAIEGYEIIHRSGIPFGVAPGNHDYDAMWSVKGYPANTNKKPSELTMTVADLGLIHVGGLSNFRSAFGDQTAFFKDKPWYVASYNGGANSAQVFSAGGYEFLHFALEMQPANDVLEWVSSVIERFPNSPTFISTHSYLDTHGERSSGTIVDLKLADPDFHTSAEELWSDLISQHDQIFMVLCGHYHGQATRVDKNQHGNEVYQLLADYQDRGQSAVDHGQPLSPYTGKPIGVGDGWFRILTFDFSGAQPRIDVTTYSNYYQTESGDLEQYAQWYRDHEQPEMTDEEFYAADEFSLPLKDFYQRFGRK